MTDQPPKELKTNAKAAAEALGISTSLIRRYALDYEKVFGIMPRSAGGARYYDEGFSQTVLKALDIRSRGLSSGLLGAFQLIKDDNVPVLEKTPVLVRTDSNDFKDLIARIDKLQKHIERLEGSQVPQLLAPSGKWTWWERLQAVLLAVLVLAGFGAIAVIFVWASENLL